MTRIFFPHDEGSGFDFESQIPFHWVLLADLALIVAIGLILWVIL